MAKKYCLQLNTGAVITTEEPFDFTDNRVDPPYKIIPEGWLSITGDENQFYQAYNIALSSKDVVFTWEEGEEI